MAKPMIKPSHRGELHRELGVPQGKKIPKAKIRADLAKAKRTGNVAEEKRDVFAENFGHKAPDGDGHKGRGVVPRGEAHQENHRAPETHEEFHKLGNDGKY